MTAAKQTRGYDGTATSTGVPVVTGTLYGTDSLTGLTQAFASKNALGTDLSTLNVKAGYTLADGNAGGNYAVTLIPATGTITPAPLTFTAVTQSRAYDGTTTATGIPIATGTLYGTDSLSGLSESYASKNALGANLSTLNVNTGYTLSDGNAGKNYSVTLAAASGTITPAPLTISAVTQSKVYDGATSSTGTPVLTGTVYTGDSLTGLGQSYASKNALGTNSSTLDVSYTLSDGNAGKNYSVTLAPAAGTITPATLALSVSKVDKTYSGDATATPTFTDNRISGDILNIVYGSASYNDRNVGTAKPVTISGLALSGADAGNYSLSAPSGAITGSITQLDSVAWTGGGGTDTLWSNPANWAGKAIPDRANVAGVVLNGTVTYDYASGAADAPVLKSLNLSGGTLTVDSATLSVPTWLQSAGTLRGTGGLTITGSMTMNGAGIIDVGGPVTITHTGNLQLGRVATAGALSVTATGTLSGTTAAGTWMHTGNSILLDANGIGSQTDMFQTTTGNLTINNHSGDAWVHNTGLVNVTGSSAGLFHLESVGGIKTGASQIKGGAVDLIADGPITIGSGGVLGQNGVRLRSDSPAADSNIVINGPLSAPAGTVTVAAYKNITQNANITGAGVSVRSSTGNIVMAPTAQTLSTGGDVSYQALAGNMTLARIDAGSSGVTLDASGSISSAEGVTGANIKGASAHITAGGNLHLTTDVQLLDVDVDGSFLVTNGTTVFSSVQPDSGGGGDQSSKDLASATDKISTDKTPTADILPPLAPPQSDSNKSDPSKSTGGTEGSFGGDDKKDDTKKDDKDKKSDTAKDEKKDDKPVAKRVAQCSA